MYRTVITICTAQWSLYVPYSGHYMYRTVVTICTAQWSLYVPHSGHYMYRTMVTICTYSDHYMYRTVVTICTTSLTFNNSTFCPHPVFMCFVWISEQTAILSLYKINWLVFITEMKSIYCVVRTGYLYTAEVNICLEIFTGIEKDTTVCRDSTQNCLEGTVTGEHSTVQYSTVTFSLLQQIQIQGTLYIYIYIHVYMRSIF